jgi:hypothetical protein
MRTFSASYVPGVLFAVLANKDATVEIVGLVRDVIEIAHIESVRSRSAVGTIVRMLPGTLRGSFHD